MVRQFLQQRLEKVTLSINYKFPKFSELVQQGEGSLSTKSVEAAIKAMLKLTNSDSARYSKQFQQWRNHG